MFESARLKVDRAKHHVRDLQHTLRSYAQAAVIKFQPEGRFAVIKVDTKAQAACGLVIGDAVHNLHSALDHAFWELMGFDSGDQNGYTKFPIHDGGNRVNYEASINGIKAAGDTKALLVEIGAYKDGPGNILCALHSCDIADKHAVLTPVLGVTSLEDCVIVQPNGARHVWTLSTFFETFARPDGRAVIYPYGEGRFEKKDNAKATLSIHFGEVDFVKLQPVIPELDAFRLAVTSTIDRFERMVRARGRIDPHGGSPTDTPREIMSDVYPGGAR